MSYVYSIHGDSYEQHDCHASHVAHVCQVAITHHMHSYLKTYIRRWQLDDDGFLTIFGDAKWKICKGFRVIARGYRSDTSYPLYVYSVSDHAVAVTEQPNVSLWHV